MHLSTVKLHRSLIRSVKAIIAAWEAWVDEFDPKEEPKKK